MNVTTAAVIQDADTGVSTLPSTSGTKFPPTDITSDVAVPLSVIVGLLLINVFVLLFIFRMKRRMPGEEALQGDMEELGKILPSADEKSRQDVERI